MSPPPHNALHPVDSTLPFVGRQNELRMLREVLTAAQSGQGRVALLSGEAGIGKSTLALALVREALADGNLVLSGGSYALTTTPPYGPWIELFSRPSVSANEGFTLARWRGVDQADLFDHVANQIRELAREQPVVLLLEDMHWADVASLDLLRYVSRGISTLPVLLLVTSRPYHPSSDTLAQPQLAALVREAHPLRIELRRLSRADLDRLLAERYALTMEDTDQLGAYLDARATGNPLFSGEILRMLEYEQVLQRSDQGWRLHGWDERRSLPVPPLVRSIIDERLSYLKPATRALLEVAAVIGQDVPLHVWQAVSDASDDDLIRVLEHTREAALLVEAPDELHVRFSHALVRETLYLSQVLPRRRQRHRRVADVLARLPDPEPDGVADHFERADDPRAIEWLIEAATRAHGVHAAHDVIAQLSRALALAARFERDVPAHVYRVRASAYHVTGAFEQAHADFSRARDLAQAAGDVLLASQLALDLGMLWVERDYQQAGSYFRAALEMAQRIGDAQMTASALNRSANWHMNQEQIDTALALHHEALAIFQQLGDRAGIGETLDLLAVTSFFACDGEQSAAYYEQAIDVLREQDDSRRLASSLSTLALNGGHLGSDVVMPVYRPPGYWQQCAQEGLAAARASGYRAAEAYALAALAMVTGTRGEIEQALHVATEAASLAERIEHRQWMIMSRWVRGLVRWELGDDEGCLTEIEQALLLARRIASGFWIATLSASLIGRYVRRGDVAHARALLSSSSADDLDSSGRGARYVQAAYAELLLAEGDAAGALARIDRLRKRRNHAHVPQLMRLRGAALARLRRYAEAEEAYRVAREQSQIFGFVLLHPEIEVALAGLYAEQGRVAEARAAHGAARAAVLALAERIEDPDMRATYQRATHERLGMSGDDARRRSSPGLAAGSDAPRLSPREVEVLRLVAQGLTDADIAERLFISPRTVSGHLQSIYNKLTLSSRAAAAAYAVQHDLI